jgi:gas vesicle protein
LQRKQSTASSIIGSLSLFAGGLAVGAVAALLLAPKPGTDLREDLKTRLRRAKEGEDPSRPVVTREENNTSRAY